MYFAYPKIITLALVAALAVAGCNKSISPAPKIPAKLIDIANPQVALQAIFNANVAKHSYPLQVALHGESMIVASGSTVQMLNYAGSVWSVNIGETIVAGVALDKASQTAIVTTRQGKIVAINSSTGDILWQQSLKATVLTPALIVGNRVLLSANDGVIYGLNLQSGALIWQYATQSPDISVRGTAKPLHLDDDTAIFAMADGRIYALLIDSGQALWTRRIGVATGGSDIGRMADSDGTPLVAGRYLYATSYSGQLAGFDMATGRTMFLVHELATTKPVALLQGVLFGVDKEGMVMGFDATTGEKLWQSDALKFRNPSNPVSIGDYIAIGDYQGVVHLLNKNGELVGRGATKGAISNLQSHHNKLYTQTQSGQVTIWQLR